MLQYKIYIGSNKIFKNLYIHFVKTDADIEKGLIATASLTSTIIIIVSGM